MNKTYLLLESMVQGSDWTPHIQKFSVDFLDDIRDRNVGNTTNDDQGNEWSMEELEQDIRKNGFKEPLVVTVGIDDKHIRLERGNHRIICAKKMNLSHVPVVCLIKKTCDLCNGHKHKYLYPGPMNTNHPVGSYVKPYSVFQL